MDHARKIGKTDAPFSWATKRSPPSSLHDKPSSFNEEETEDRRLVNWRKWLADREKHYRHYEKNYGRKRQDLLIISDIDEIRQKIEMNDLIEGIKLSISSKATDERRGNPDFWMTPEALPKRGNPNLPDIFVTLSRKQMSLEPAVERIVLPELIKREKGLSEWSRKPTALERAKVNLGKRDEKLQREMKSLEAQQSEMSQLALKGRGVQRRTTKCRRKIPFAIVEIMETFKPDDESQSDANERETPDDDEDNAVVLMIQDREIAANCGIRSRESHEQSDYFTWSLIFRSTDSGACQRQIRLENRCNRAVIYRWRQASSNTSFVSPIPPKSPFFFNKNKGIILPREVVRLSVWFRSRLPRVATEFWALTTEPPICKESLTFRFWGSAISSNDFPSRDAKSSFDDSASLSVENHLNRRVRDATIREIIDTMIGDAQLRNDLPSVSYKSLFLEDEIFRAKNPMYFHRSDLVRKLREIYENATSKLSPSWNLSLVDLRRILLAIEDRSVRNEVIGEFNELCRNLLKRHHCESAENAKRSMVYNSLCCFFDKFEIERDYIMSKCSKVEKPNEGISGEASADIGRSESVASSQASRKKSRKINRVGKSRTSSKASISSSINRHEVTENSSGTKIMKKCPLYDEVFFVRIREILSNTIIAACAIIDTVNNFNPSVTKL